MKRTRIFAALLCIMMMVCSIPMMQVAAAATTVAEVVGKEVTPQYTITFADGAVNLPTGISMKDVGGCTYTAENGVLVGDGASGTFRPTEGSNTTPMSYPAMSFKIKAPAGGSVEFQAVHPELKANGDIVNERGVRINVTEGAVKASGVATSFVPGNDWVDYLIVPAAEAYDVYANQGSGWVLIADDTAWDGGARAGQGFKFLGTGAYVKDINIYREGSAEDGGGDDEGGTVDPIPSACDTIEEAVGKKISPLHDLQPNSGFVAPEGINVRETSHDFTYSDANGVEVGTAGTAGLWTLTEGSGTTPLAYAAVVFGAKLTEDGSMIVQASHPEFQTVAGNPNNRKAYIILSTTGISVGGNGTAVTNLLPGTEWVDYLVMANNQEGYSVYAKHETLTEGKWALLKATTSWQSGGGGQGIQFNASGSGAYISYATIYQQADGTESDAGIGTTQTLDEILDGVGESGGKLTFDAEFDGDAEDAQLRDISSGVVAGQPTITADGVTLSSMPKNQALTWRYGSEKAWKPLTKTSPVMFRAKATEGSCLDVQMNGRPSAKISITPEAVTLHGLRPKEAPDFVPGSDWVNYLVTTDGTNFILYAQRDSEEVWTLIGVSERFQPGGYFGISFQNTQAGVAYVEYVEQLKILKPILDDVNAIASANNKIYLNEYFLSNDNGWTLTGCSMTDGTLTGSGTAVYDLSDINIADKWYLSTKVKATGTGGVSGVIHNDSLKITWTFDGAGLVVNDVQNTVKVDLNQWYELLFVYDKTGKVNVYRRAMEENSVVKTHTDISAVEESGDSLTFSVAAGAVDDVKIYTGDYFGAESMEILGGSYQVKGEYFSGTMESEYDRRGVMIAAAYDKEYGYTTFAEAVEYPRINSGYGVDFSTTFAGTGLAAGENDLAVMMWDTLENGIPLGMVAGTPSKNTTTDKLMAGQKPGLTVTEKFNEVVLSGYTGVKNGMVTASLIDGDGVLRAVGQGIANADGMITMGVAVDPVTASGTYTLCYQYGTGAATKKTVTLHGSEIDYNGINSVSSMSSFINTYGGESAKKWNQQEGFAAEVYARFLEEKGTTESFANLYEFRKVMDVALDEEMEERELCAALNTAIKNGKWTNARDYLYASDLGISAEDLSSIDNPKNVFMGMGYNHTSKEGILKSFEDSLKKQKKLETSGGNTGGGGGGGGAGGGGGVITKDDKDMGMLNGSTGFETEDLPNSITPPELSPMQKFNDIASVSWAKESIEQLQLMGVISGDGDGGFYPNRSVTREEFLKMAMQAAGIVGNGDAVVAFADVEQDAWYYEFVAAAYQQGIIQGMSDTQFGIGQQITRSDMAVMLKRILEHQGIDASAIRASVVFDDFNTIPEYARKSVLALYEAGLMNGMGENLFAGDASATRAEAATAIYRIYEYMEERR